MKTLLLSSYTFKTTYAGHRSFSPKALFKDVLRFLRHPKVRASSDSSLAIRVRQVGLLTVANFFLAAVVGLLLTFLRQQGMLEETELSPEYRKLFEHLPMALLAGVGIAPLLEEFLFRSWLRSPHQALYVLSALPLYGLFVVLQPVWTMPVLYFWLGYLVIGILIEGLGRTRIHRLDAALYPFFSRIFPLLFYGSVLMFGFVHVSNYTHVPLLLYPLVTLPQLISGCLLGYTRMRYGFWYGVGQHGLHNLVCILVMFLFQ
ncbi:hypothetical protein BWI97_18835 [Siphonobacter sp. BAB-5405]|uniref:CPBP family glutamic-type intramembrane protease n=1 Tax=Siphonobacter sp. BAB-5405 TaxID=1864825 RepID=UPI000C7FD947|nr:CPBP family glutamic-type intramembrane protease [Siphonobacter sp. BAB-5405]PMD93110.1 hypothetical protein BWI97_18835 [Siphonobacter sp. BAB-5405]